jgi:cholesterol transport system auxiliary component
MRPAFTVTAVSMLVLVAGCANVLLGPEREPPETYRLSVPAIAATAAARLPLALSVTQPRAPQSLDTDRIAVVQPELRFEHYTGLRWSEPAPQMLQSLLVSSLQSTGRYEAVLSAPSRVPADLLLDVELQRFEADYTTPGAAPVVKVQLQVTLVDARRGLRLSSLVASGQSAAAADRRSEVMAAFERATTVALGDVAAWLVVAPPPSPSSPKDGSG